MAIDDANVTDRRFRPGKMENENSNTLKTKGYQFEHNFGNGQRYISALQATLILFAYLVHVSVLLGNEAKDLSPPVVSQFKTQ